MDRSKNFVSGVKVVESDDCGRVAVATRAFAPGAVVFRESPAIVFDPSQEKDHEYHGLFESYLRASPQTKRDILDMHCPSPEEIAQWSNKKVGAAEYDRLEQERQYFLQNHPNEETQLTVDISRKLVSIVDANAMAFGEGDGQHLDLLDSDYEDSKDEIDHFGGPNQKMALFSIGSKTEHSCCPNLTWTTQRRKMECVAETYIEPGDRLSISYVSNVFERPCQERRDVLQENKFFYCNCNRCRSLDACRPLWCHCREGGVLLWSGQKKKWVCTSCEQTKERDLFLVSAIQVETELETLIQKYKWKIDNDPRPSLLDEIIQLTTTDQWQNTLHPLHWLNASAYKLISTTSALRTNMQMMEESYPPPLSKFSPLLRLFSLALLRQIGWLERSVSLAREALAIEDLGTCEELFKGGGESDNVGGGYLQFSTKGANKDDLIVAVADLCKSIDSISENGEEKKEDIASREVAGSEVAVSVFHAGQNLILTGDSDLALRLYKVYDLCIQRSSTIGADDKSRLRTFLSTNGHENPFVFPFFDA